VERRSFHRRPPIAKPNAKQCGPEGNNTSWDKFEAAMRQIVSVPHAEIKAHLDAEKEAKKLKRTRKSKYAAFRKVNREP
jgi:hypothetical protein